MANNTVSQKAEKKATEAAHGLAQVRERLKQSQTQARRTQDEREEIESLEMECSEGWTPPDIDEFFERESERWAELLELLRKS